MFSRCGSGIVGERSAALSVMSLHSKTSVRSAQTLGHVSFAPLHSQPTRDYLRPQLAHRAKVSLLEGKFETPRQTTFHNAWRATQGSHWSDAHCTQFFFAITGCTHQRGTSAELSFAYNIHPCACTSSSEANDLFSFFRYKGGYVAGGPGTLMAN
jgi:hypothetical protein